MSKALRVANKSGKPFEKKLTQIYLTFCSIFAFKWFFVDLLFYFICTFLGFLWSDCSSLSKHFSLIVTLEIIFGSAEIRTWDGGVRATSVLRRPPALLQSLHSIIIVSFCWLSTSLRANYFTSLFLAKSTASETKKTLQLILAFRRRRRLRRPGGGRSCRPCRRSSVWRTRGRSKTWCWRGRTAVKKTYSSDPVVPTSTVCTNYATR